MNEGSCRSASQSLESYASCVQSMGSDLTPRSGVATPTSGNGNTTLNHSDARQHQPLLLNDIAQTGVNTVSANSDTINDSGSELAIPATVPQPQGDRSTTKHSSLASHDTASQSPVINTQSAQSDELMDALNEQPVQNSDTTVSQPPRENAEQPEQTVVVKPANHPPTSHILDSNLMVSVWMIGAETNETFSTIPLQKEDEKNIVNDSAGESSDWYTAPQPSITTGEPVHSAGSRGSSEENSGAEKNLITAKSASPANSLRTHTSFKPAIDASSNHSSQQLNSNQTSEHVVRAEAANSGDNINPQGCSGVTPANQQSWSNWFYNGFSYCTKGFNRLTGGNTHQQEVIGDAASSANQETVTFNNEVAKNSGTGSDPAINKDTVVYTPCPPMPHGPDTPYGPLPDNDANITPPINCEPNSNETSEHVRGSSEENSGAEKSLITANSASPANSLRIHTSFQSAIDASNNHSSQQLNNNETSEHVQGNSEESSGAEKNLITAKSASPANSLRTHTSFKPAIDASSNHSSQQLNSNETSEHVVRAEAANNGDNINPQGCSDVTPANQQSWSNWFYNGFSYCTKGFNRLTGGNTHQQEVIGDGASSANQETVTFNNEVAKNSGTGSDPAINKDTVVDTPCPPMPHSLPPCPDTPYRPLPGNSAKTPPTPINCEPKRGADEAVRTMDVNGKSAPESQPGFVESALKRSSYYVNKCCSIAKGIKDQATNFYNATVPEVQEATQNSPPPLSNAAKVGNMIYQAAASYLMEQNLSLGNHKVTTQNKEQTVEAVAKLINVLVTGFSAKEGMSPCMQDDINLDEITVGNQVFSAITARINRLDSGGLKIEDLSFHVNSSEAALAKKGGIACQLKNIQISCAFSAQEQQQSSAIGSVLINSPQQSAVDLCKAFCPQQVVIKIENCSAEFQDYWLVRNETGQQCPTDDIGFTLKDTSIQVAINKTFYPGISPDITVNPGTVEGRINSSGIISNIWGQVTMDDNRCGEMKVRLTVDLSKISFFLKIFFGTFQVNFKAEIKDGVVALDDLRNHITLPFGNSIVRFFVELVVDNSLKSRLSGLRVNDGNNMFQLNVVLLDEEGECKKWPTLVKWINDKFQMASVSIPLPFCGLKPEEPGKKGLGHIVLGELTRGIFPYNSSLHYQKHEQLIDAAEKSTQPNALAAADEVLTEAEEMRKSHNFSAEEYLYRRLPIPLAVAWANNAQDANAQKQLLRLLAILTDVMPHKAVQIMHATLNHERFPKTDAGGNFLVRLLQQRLSEPESGSAEEISEFRRQNELLKDLLFFWSQSQLHGDCSMQNLADPDAQAEPGKEFFERMARLSKSSGGFIASLMSLGLFSATSFITGLGAPVAGIIELAMQINNLNDQSNRSNLERFTKALDDYEQSEAQQLNTEPVNLVQMAANAMAAEPKEMVTDSQFSRKVLNHYFGLAHGKISQTLAGNDVESWRDSRYWLTIGALCNAGRCSTHEAVERLLGHTCADFYSQLSFAACHLESFSGGPGANLAIRNFFANAQPALLQQMVDYYINNTEADSQSSAFTNLRQMPSLPAGQERLQVMHSLEDWRLRDMVRPYHRMLENRACLKIIAQVKQIKQFAQQMLENSNAQEQEPINAWCDDQCKALLSVLPLERMGEQLVKARRVGDELIHSQAYKYYLMPTQREELSNVLGQAYEVAAEYFPARITPGVLTETHENQLLSTLLRQSLESKSTSELLQTHLLSRIIKDKTGQLFKPGEDSAESHQNTMAGILLSFSGLFPTLSFGGQLLLKALKYQYSSSFEPNDGQLSSWQGQLGELFAQNKNTLGSLFSQKVAPQSAAAEGGTAKNATVRIAEICKQSVQIPTEGAANLLSKQPLIPANAKSLTKQNMIDMIRMAFADLPKEDLLRLCSPYLQDDGQDYTTPCPHKG